MTQLDDLPTSVTLEADGRSVALTADEAVYPLEAVFAAAYVFIDRCFVFVDRPTESSIRVTLSPKTPREDADALRSVVGEFANELLSSAWRRKITQENRVLIESVTTQALAGAMGPPSLDDLQSFDFSEETFDDPLGIAMSWEDKYKKKAKTVDGATTAEGESTPTTSKDEPK